MVLSLGCSSEVFMTGVFWFELAVDAVLHVGLHLLVAFFVLSEGFSLPVVLLLLAVTVCAHLLAKAIVHLLVDRRQK